MPTNRHLLAATLALPLAGAALALTASGAAALPVGTGHNPPPPQELGLPPVASLQVSPKIAIVSTLPEFQSKGIGAPGLVEGLDGDLVQFDAGNSSDPDGDALTYDWDLDGNGLYELLDAKAEQSKRYYATGTFTVRVRVHDEGGNSEVDTEQLIVHAAPRARIAAIEPAPLVGQTVHFTSSASTADPAIVGRRWDLDGDGTYETDTGTETSASTSYGTPGARTVRLRITDTYGVTSVASVVTKVGSVPTGTDAPPAPAGPAGGVTTGSGAAQADRLALVPRLGKKKLRLAKNGKVSLKLTCPAGESRCQGTVKLRGTGKGSKLIATGRFSIAGGRSANVRLLLPAVRRQAIRRGSTLQAKAIIAVSDAAGNQGTSTTGILIGL